MPGKKAPKKAPKTVEEPKKATPKVSGFEAKAKEVGCGNKVSFAYKVLGNPMYNEYLEEARKVLADNK